MAEVERLSPQITVGVAQHGPPFSKRQVTNWAAARVSRLTSPRLIELVDFGAEGGIYKSRWGEFQSDETGLQLDVKLNRRARREGLSPEALSLRLVHLAEPTNRDYREELAKLLQEVAIRDGNTLRVQWSRSHVRPESLMQIHLRDLTENASPPGVYRVATENNQEGSRQYQLSSSSVGGPQILIEQTFPSEEAALSAITQGDIDALDQVAPWHLDQLRQVDNIVVGHYRLPTVHVLIPNYDKPLLNRREFRRALSYGIDRRRIVDDILLGGKSQPGFRVLSGPLPAGLSRSDPIGYAYKHEIQPRPYEPRLAAVLAAVARNSLAKIAKSKEEPAENPAEKPTVKTSETEDSPESVLVDPLILAHPPSDVARTACQTMKLQLDAIGIPIQLAEWSPQQDTTMANYDLRYAELTLWEPVVDARQLLGPGGAAGSCSPSMSLALQDVDESRNWKEARTRLREVHQMAFYDLPVIPLWQTVNYFARRQSLSGVGDSPVSLYQNIAKWRNSFAETGR